MTRHRAAPLVPEREQFISHADGNEMWRLQATKGDPQFTELTPRGIQWADERAWRTASRAALVARSKMGDALRVEEVWHALTDSASLAEWLMENDFKPMPGHKFHFRSKSRFGIERLIPCEVLVVDEPRLLSWNWGDEGSLVTFRLEVITGGTRLILEHTGLKGVRGLALAWVLSHGWARKIVHSNLPDELRQENVASKNTPLFNTFGLVSPVC